MSRVKYLQELCNKYGDFSVCLSFIKNKETIWSKHRSVLELWHSDWGLDFLNRVNHRQVLPVEIVLDKDDRKNLLWIGDTISTLKAEHQRFKAYRTGSRGYHIHIFSLILGTYSRYKREEERVKVIERFGCELQKASDKAFIAIPNIPHFKTGKVKELIASGI